MSKRMVEQQLCDTPGCDMEASANPCGRCGHDGCYKHVKPLQWTHGGETYGTASTFAGGIPSPAPTLMYLCASCMEGVTPLIRAAVGSTSAQPKALAEKEKTPMNTDAMSTTNDYRAERKLLDDDYNAKAKAKATERKETP